MKGIRFCEVVLVLEEATRAALKPDLKCLFSSGLGSNGGGWLLFWGWGGVEIDAHYGLFKFSFQFQSKHLHLQIQMQALSIGFFSSRLFDKPLNKCFVLSSEFYIPLNNRKKNPLFFMLARITWYKKNTYKMPFFCLRKHFQKDPRTLCKRK